MHVLSSHIFRIFRSFGLILSIIISLLSLSFLCRRNNLNNWDPRLLVLLSAKKRVYYSALQVRASLLSSLQSIVKLRVVRDQDLWIL